MEVWVTVKSGYCTVCSRVEFKLKYSLGKGVFKYYIGRFCSNADCPASGVVCIPWYTVQDGG